MNSVKKILVTVAALATLGGTALTSTQASASCGDYGCRSYSDGPYYIYGAYDYSPSYSYGYYGYDWYGYDGYRYRHNDHREFRGHDRRH